MLEERTPVDSVAQVMPPVAAAPSSDDQTCPKCGQMIRREAMVCRFCAYTIDLALRRQQALEEEERARAQRLRKYVRQSACGWLFVAVLQFVLSGILSASWGVVCVVLGVIGLAAPVRAMLLVNGCAMILLGIGNALASFSGGGPGFMTYLGVMQVVWGVKELKRFATGEVLESK